MVAYTIQALLVILVEVPYIQGLPTFKALWDVIRALLPIIHKIKHPDNPVEGMVGMTIEAATYVLVSIRPWLVPDHMGEVFTIPRCCVTETDQQTEERNFTAKTKCKTNYDNLATFLGTMWERVIKPNFHTGGSTMGRGEFRLRTLLEIFRCLQRNFGMPGAQEQDDATT